MEILLMVKNNVKHKYFFTANVVASDIKTHVKYYI